MPDQTPEPIGERPLAEIESRASRVCRCDDTECVADLIQLGDKDVPALIAEVRRWAGELAKYTGWEPTVREEYEHACDQLRRVEGIVKWFDADRGLSQDPLTLASNVDSFVASLKHALES